MTKVYRTLRRRYAKDPLGGEASCWFGGRWSSPGTRLASTAEHLSLAMVEYFVHIDAADTPKDLVVVAADIPGRVSRKRLAPGGLPPHWRQTPPSPALAAIGGSFAAAAKTAIRIVPSVLVPTESNWLINPLHPQFANIRVHLPAPFEYDGRFFG